VDELLPAAQRLSGGRPSAEALWLAGRASWLRRDQPAEARARAAIALWERVGPPWDLHAAYGRAAVRVARRELAPALADLEQCAAAAGAEGARREVRELCALGVGRVLGAQGKYREAAAAYAAVPPDSPHFADAAHEVAYAWLKAGEAEEALRWASLLSDLEPDAPLGPQATLLRADVLQRVGRQAEAVEIYRRVLERYAPVRDEVEALLLLRDDPSRDLELLARRDLAADAAAVLPPLALRWAARRAEVERAQALAAGLEAARRLLADARREADGLQALLDRNWGMGAFPALEQAYLESDAAQTVAIQVEAELAGELFHLLPISPVRAEVEALRAGRAELERTVRALPASTAALEARRLAAADRAAARGRALHQLGAMVEGIDEEVAAVSRYVEAHRAEMAGAGERPALAEELRRHRAVAEGYRAELAELGREVARQADQAGMGLAPAEDRQRFELRERLAQEAEAAAPARRVLDPLTRDRAARLDALRARAAEVISRADRVKRGLLARARASGEAPRARLAAERRELEAAARDLDRAQASARALVGRVARRALDEVRRSFHDLVQQADVGIVDVAWTRRRERMDRIQALSARKAAEIEAVDAAARGGGR
jgi:tetratricopeptide (TPR) repeat protein